MNNFSRAIYRYDSQTGVLLDIIPDTNIVFALGENWGDFSGDGRTVAYTTMAGTVVWRELPSGRLLYEIKDSTRILGRLVRCSFNGKFIAMLNFDSTLTVWDTEKLRLHYFKQLQTIEVHGIASLHNL